MTETYRTKFYNKLLSLNDFLHKYENNQNNENNENPKNEIKDFMKKFYLLSKIAINEINNDDTIENKDKEKANYGLDCLSIYLNSLLMFSMKYLDNNELSLFLNEINNIDCFNENFVCEF